MSSKHKIPHHCICYPRVTSVERVKMKDKPVGICVAEEVTDSIGPPWWSDPQELFRRTRAACLEVGSFFRGGITDPQVLLNTSSVQLTGYNSTFLHHLKHSF